MIENQVSSLKQKPFPLNLFQGGVNRISYIASTILGGVFLAVSLFIFTRIGLSTGLALLITLPFYILYAMSFLIRRLHDSNSSLIDYFSLNLIGFDFLVTLKPGNSGPNKYGGPPGIGIRLFK